MDAHGPGLGRALGGAHRRATHGQLGGDAGEGGAAAAQRAAQPALQRRRQCLGGRGLDDGEVWLAILVHAVCR